MTAKPLRGRKYIAGCTLTRASRRLQKRPQPPRPLPSPATKRARDLQRALKQKSFCVTRSLPFQPLSRTGGPSVRRYVPPQRQSASYVRMEARRRIRTVRPDSENARR